MCGHIGRAHFDTTSGPWNCPEVWCWKLNGMVDPCGWDWIPRVIDPELSAGRLIDDDCCPGNSILSLSPFLASSRSLICHRQPHMVSLSDFNLLSKWLLVWGVKIMRDWKSFYELASEKDELFSSSSPTYEKLLNILFVHHLQARQSDFRSTRTYHLPLTRPHLFAHVDLIWGERGAYISNYRFPFLESQVILLVKPRSWGKCWVNFDN